MVEQYLLGVLGQTNLSRAVRSYAKSVGNPSPTEGYGRKTLVHFQGQWRAGQQITTTAAAGDDIIPSSTKFIEGNGILNPPVAFEDCTWDGVDTLTLPAGSFTDTDWHADWQVWITSTDGSWVRGVYGVASATGDDLVLADTNSLGFPGATDLTTGYLLKGVYAEVYNAIGAPHGSTSRESIAANNDTSIEQSPWHDYGVWVPPAALTTGGVFHMKLFGRLRMRYLTGRPYSDGDGDGIYDTVDKAVVYLTLDPFSSSLAMTTEGGNEIFYRPTLPARLGWTPENKFTAATWEDDGSGNMRVVYTSHGLLDGDQITIVAGNSVGLPSSLVAGETYYVANKTTNKFELSRDLNVGDQVAYVAPSSPTAEELVISKSCVRGTRHAMTWKFTFGTADEITDFRNCEIDVWGFADGRTANTEEGVIWRATMRVDGIAELVGGTDIVQEVADSTAKEWSAAVLRTTPGDAMDVERGGTLSATAAPLLLSKASYFTPSDTVSFTGATATESGANDNLTHESFYDLKIGDAITITAAGTSGLSLTTYYVHSFVSNRKTVKLAATVGGAAVSIANSTADVDGTFTPSYNAFVSSMWDYGGNYDIVYLSAGLVSDTTSTTAGESEYAITPTFQGSDVANYTTSGKNSQGYRRATITTVERGGTPIADVIYHDDVRRMLFVRNYVHGEHIRYGDTLTFKTYRNTRANGTASTWTWESSPIQTKTDAATALLVKHGPQGTRLSTRIAVSGPPTGDCALDVRGGFAEIFTQRSR